MVIIRQVSETTTYIKLFIFEYVKKSQLSNETMVYTMVIANLIHNPQ